MSYLIMSLIIIFHLVFGILVPFLFVLKLKDREDTSGKTLSKITAWKYTSWSIFFAASSLFILINYSLNKSLGGVVVFIIGVVPFGILCLFYLYQSIVNWRKGMKGI